MPSSRGELRNWVRVSDTVFTGEIFNDPMHGSPDGASVIIKATEVKPYPGGLIIWAGEWGYSAIDTHKNKRGTLL